MLSDFNYQSVPYGFSHCLNGQCKHATECLHYQVALHVPTECRSFTLINPAYTTSDNGDCPCFTSDQPLRFARGITHLLDNMTHSNALAVKQKMLAHFGGTHSTVSTGKSVPSVRANSSTSVRYSKTKASTQSLYTMNTSKDMTGKLRGKELFHQHETFFSPSDENFFSPA